MALANAQQAILRSPKWSTKLRNTDKGGAVNFPLNNKMWGVAHYSAKNPRGVRIKIGSQWIKQWVRVRGGRRQGNG